MAGNLGLNRLNFRTLRGWRSETEIGEVPLVLNENAVVHDGLVRPGRRVRDGIPLQDLERGASRLEDDQLALRRQRQERPARRYERGSIIITSNQSLTGWGEVFGDAVMATAILDRLLHHSTTLNIKGESYRLKEKRKAGLLGRTLPQIAEPTSEEA